MSFFLNDDLELLKQSAQEFTEKYATQGATYFSVNS